MRFDLSRFKGDYVLPLLLILFGVLYFYDLARMRDLWANLFAAVIVVLIIDRIIKQTEMQKSERSMRYVRGKVGGILLSLIVEMRAPSKWQENLSKSDSNWNNYYRRVLESRAEGLEKLEGILDSHSYLLDTDLRNEMFSMDSLLGSWTWFSIEQNQQKDLWTLCDTASLAVAIMDLAKKTVKHHKLFKSIGHSMSWNKGEPPLLELGTSGIVEETQYRFYEEWLKDAIEFRDAVGQRRLEPKKAS
jgi:hypothetical protein